MTSCARSCTTLTPIFSFAPRHFSHSAGLAVLYDDMNFAYLRLYSSESLRSTALQFGWRMPSEAAFHGIGPEIDATYMSDETIRGFTGTMIGMACVESYRRNVLAHFDYFDLQNGSHLD